MPTPVIVEAAINGATTRATNPNVPKSPDEIAADALACLDAGASVIHAHCDPVSGPDDEVAERYLQGFRPDKAVLGLLPREMIRKYEAIPLKRDGNTFHVALKDPYNLTAIDDIRFHTGCHLVVNICTESEFSKFLEEHLASASLMDFRSSM